MRFSKIEIAHRQGESHTSHTVVIENACCLLPVQNDDNDGPYQGGVKRCYSIDIIFNSLHMSRLYIESSIYWNFNEGGVQGTIKSQLPGGGQNSYSYVPIGSARTLQVDLSIKTQEN